MELLEANLSEHAKLCYGVMNSFGPVCRPAIASIARRMSVSEQTVKKAQKDLVRTGWIELLKEGKGDSPREWKINRQPNKRARGYIPDDLGDMRRIPQSFKGKLLRQKPERGKYTPLPTTVRIRNLMNRVPEAELNAAGYARTK